MAPRRRAKAQSRDPPNAPKTPQMNVPIRPQTPSEVQAYLNTLLNDDVAAEAVGGTLMDHPGDGAFKLSGGNTYSGERCLHNIGPIVLRKQLRRLRAQKMVKDRLKNSPNALMRENAKIAHQITAMTIASTDDTNPPIDATMATQTVSGGTNAVASTSATTDYRNPAGNLTAALINPFDQIADSFSMSQLTPSPENFFRLTQIPIYTTPPTPAPAPPVQPSPRVSTRIPTPTDRAFRSLNIIVRYAIILELQEIQSLYSGLPMILCIMPPNLAATALFRYWTCLLLNLSTVDWVKETVEEHTVVSILPGPVGPQCPSLQEVEEGLRFLDEVEAPRSLLHVYTDIYGVDVREWGDADGEEFDEEESGE